jgi:hypothetical protein
MHIMGTGTVVTVLNNFGIKLGFYIENYIVSGHTFSSVEEEHT